MLQPIGLCEPLLELLSAHGHLPGGQTRWYMLLRAIIVEKDAVPFSEIVNAVPQPKAGGSFATTAYQTFNNPVAVEEIKADAGIDIGGTLIGMHIRKVAVPVRLTNNKIGSAYVTAARSRAKFIGGERAVYDDSMM